MKKLESTLRILIALTISLLFMDRALAYFSNLAFLQQTVFESAIFFAHLNEASGATTFADSSRSNISGTCTTCPTTGNAGVIGNSVNFNGSTSKISFGRPSQLMFDRNNAFSISVWENMSTTVTMTPAFANAYGTGGSIGWSLFLCGTSNFANCPTHNASFYMISTWATNVLNVYTTGLNLNDGSWHHLVVTYDGSSSASGVKMYVDGASVALTTQYNSLSASILNASSAVTLGLIPGDTRYYSGSIDEVAAWNYVLTPNQVKALYRH